MRKISIVFAVVLVALAGVAVAQPVGSKLYTITPGSWVRAATPTGEIFTCTVCGAQVQVEIDVGQQIGPDAEFKNNDQFLAALKTPAQQKQFANSLLHTEIPLQSGFTIHVDRTGLTTIGGVRAFQFAVTVVMTPTTTQDTTLLLIHRGRMVKITVNYYAGALNDSGQAAIKALFTSLKFI